MKRNSAEARVLHHLLNQTVISPETFIAWMSKKDHAMYKQLDSIYEYLGSQSMNFPLNDKIKNR